MWKPALDASTWQTGDALFQPTAEESGGHWQFRKPVEPAWVMRYKELSFQAQTTAGRHLGVFPEQAAHWDWISARLRAAGQQAQVLNLFGYTGMATLAAAHAGAKVTHVDASKKAVAWARKNQQLSGLEDRPVRWIVDDALKFVQREIRRGVRYDGLILDPPKFGRGPKGEVWEFFDLFPRLVSACQEVLSASPIFVVITAYAIRASGLSLHNSLVEMMSSYHGNVTSGELVLREASAGRLISLAITSRWRSDQ
jgi:23S rRNA (cytosine1962-C5)-methyltransferase